MLRLLADENFNGRIVQGLLTREPRLSLLRVQDTPLYGADDDVMLAWAADEGRVLLTHDARTIPRHAWDRVAAALPMPGVLVCDTYLAVNEGVADILLVAKCSLAEECADRVQYLPL